MSIKKKEKNHFEKSELILLKGPKPCLKYISGFDVFFSNNYTSVNLRHNMDYAGVISVTFSLMNGTFVKSVLGFYLLDYDSAIVHFNCNCW